MLPSETIMETWHKSDILFDGKVFRLRVGSVLLDTGETAYREVVEHPGGVCVLPYTGKEFILLRQFRIAHNRVLIEAPAGKLEPDETPEECGRKELREETGFVADQFISLGQVLPSVGFCNEIIHLFLAKGLRHVGAELEPEERIETFTMTVEEAREQMAGIGFEDAKTHVIVHRALNYLEPTLSA